MWWVVVCSRCQQAVVVEERVRSGRCTRCTTAFERRQKAPLGTFDTAKQAAACVQSYSESGGSTNVVVRSIDHGLDRGSSPQPRRFDVRAEEPLVQHDSLEQAAAAKAAGIRSISRRAETVLVWMARLGNPASHDQMVHAMELAGFTTERAEKEILRLMVQDVLYEPQAGSYAPLE